MITTKGILFFAFFIVLAVVVAAIIKANRKKAENDPIEKAKSARGTSTSKRLELDKKTEKVSYGPKVDAILDQGNKALAEMGRLYSSIENESIRAKINEIMRITDKIMQDAKEDPADVTHIRKFFSYYLPTTIKLLDTFSSMSAKDIESSNIDKTMKNIEEMLDVSVEAFKKRLDSLFEDQALDIETDIDVMNQLLAREGLIESKGE